MSNSKTAKVGDRVQDEHCRNKPAMFGTYGIVMAIYHGIEDGLTYYLVQDQDGKHAQYWAAENCTILEEE